MIGTRVPPEDLIAFVFLVHETRLNVSIPPPFAPFIPPPPLGVSIGVTARHQN
jgi:hypothetical protein